MFLCLPRDVCACIFAHAHIVSGPTTHGLSPAYTWHPPIGKQAGNCTLLRVSTHPVARVMHLSASRYRQYQWRPGAAHENHFISHTPMLLPTICKPVSANHDAPVLHASPICKQPTRLHTVWSFRSHHTSHVRFPTWLRDINHSPISHIPCSPLVTHGSHRTKNRSTT